MIYVRQGIYDGEGAYERDGYYHSESRKYLPMPVRFRDLLFAKWVKFLAKYNVHKFPFTFGRDSDNHIESIAICHTTFDNFKDETGEKIVIGRIKRMRGEIRTPYDQNETLLDKDGKHTDILKHPWILQLTNGEVKKYG